MPRPIRGGIRPALHFAASQRVTDIWLSRLVTQVVFPGLLPQTGAGEVTVIVLPDENKIAKPKKRACKSLLVWHD